MDQEVFWTGAAAAIAGGAITGIFALGVGLISARSEARRHLARERRIAYTRLLAGVNRVDLLVTMMEMTRKEELPSPIVLERWLDESLAFHDVTSAAQVVASPRTLQLVQRTGNAVNAFLNYLNTVSEEDRDRLDAPVRAMLAKIQEVFVEEVRFEIEVGEAPWYVRWWRLRKDPSERVVSELEGLIDEFADATEEK